MDEVKIALDCDPGSAVSPVQGEDELLQSEVQGLQRQGHVHCQLHQSGKQSGFQVSALLAVHAAALLHHRHPMISHFY
jgi:hypothetical protein